METNKAWQFLVLPMIVYLLFIVFPFVQSVWFSFTDWDGLSEGARFVWFRNYRQVIQDLHFQGALKNNLIWVGFFILVPTSLGLVLALLLSKGIPGSLLFKSVIYLPMIFSYVIIGMIWTFVYEPRLGIINLVIRAASGIEKFNFAWLSNPSTALYAVIVAAGWQHTGLCMVLYLAGLSGVREDLIEAAKIDGCRSAQIFRHVILPQLRNTTVVVISLTIITALKSFDIVYIMTKGGPYRKSEILTTLVYRESFWNYKMGYAITVANMLFLIILLIMIVYLHITMEGDDNG